MKSYFKAELSVHRIEPEFHGPDLERYGISNLPDFEKFAALIPKHHIFFGRIDYAVLASRLTAEGHGSRGSGSDTTKG